VGFFTGMPFLDYELPPELIAQQPAERRDASRLLVVRRGDGSLEHRRFRDLPDLLNAGDLLVLNDTRVLPARLLGKRERTGGKWEGLYIGERDGVWELLCQTRGTLQAEEVVIVSVPEALATAIKTVANASGSDGLRLRYLGRTPDGHFLFRPESLAGPADLLARFGHVPLPPYVRKGRDAPADAERYQTVYARRPGAVAAPTAGLHFTEEVFARLRERGVTTTTVTLHVGLGTFQPLQSDDPTKHVMHREWCELPAAATDAVTACKARGGRVVAVGTTAVRTLESAARHSRGTLAEWSGETDLFIYPPYNFRVVDAMVTNFHLPKTSLLLLVGAFAGEDLLRSAYAEAISHRYRFYSYGDAMLVL
jgi:S-adenosylmethionine:tRNA ribosyltransferase-isomerase